MSTSQRMTAAQERALLAYADEFAVLKPWSYLDDGNAFSIQLLDAPLMTICVLGAGGISYGMPVYLGPAGRACYFTMLDHRSTEAERHRVMLSTDMLRLDLEKPSLLDPRELRRMMVLGRRVAGQSRVPLVSSMKAGRAPADLNAEEANWLLRAWPQILELLRLAKKEPDLLAPGETLHVARETAPGVWVRADEPLTDSDFLPDQEFTIQTGGVSKQVKDLPPSSDIWQVLFRTGMGRVGRSRAQAEWVLVLLVVDKERGIPLIPQVMQGSADPAVHAQAIHDTLLNLMARLQVRPSALEVDDEAMSLVLQPLSEGLELPVKFAGALEPGEAIYQELVEFMNPAPRRKSAKKPGKKSK